MNDQNTAEPSDERNDAVSTGLFKKAFAKLLSGQELDADEALLVKHVRPEDIERAREQIAEGRKKANEQVSAQQDQLIKAAIPLLAQGAPISEQQQQAISLLPPDRVQGLINHARRSTLSSTSISAAFSADGIRTMRRDTSSITNER